MTTEILREEESAEELLRKAQQTYAEIGAALRDGIETLKASTDPKVRAYSQTLNLFWKSLQTVDEREKDLETFRRARNGIADGYAIDLAQARREVGRRLARLAAAAED